MAVRRRSTSVPNACARRLEPKEFLEISSQGGIRPENRNHELKGCKTPIWNPADLDQLANHAMKIRR